MKYRSVLGKSPEVDFVAALMHGLAADGSLYIPEHIPSMPPSLLSHLESTTLHTLAYEVLSRFIRDIPSSDLRHIIERTFNFPLPLTRLDDRVDLLELFHGPTLAFKDVGARFMAEALSYVMSRSEKQITIVVATSGDTGSAVARGFFNVPHVTVFVLYPSGKISRLQEQQMTTLGGNIHAVEVEGTFDDCQRLVKEALGDGSVQSVRPMTTANSINVGRLLPQIVYYFWAIAQLKRMHHGEAPPAIVVPSGNFGNLTAALYAKKMGLPAGQCCAIHLCR